MLQQVSVQKWKMLIQIWWGGREFRAYLYSILIDSSWGGGREEEKDASLPFPQAVFYTGVGAAKAAFENQAPHVSQLGSILW